jgi:hypothetical protein
LAILTARRAGWFSRAVRWLLLVLLIAGAGAASVQRAVKGYAPLPDTWVDVGVAVAPWAILVLAVWLWIAMIKQLRARRGRTGRDEADRTAPAAETGVEPVPDTVVDQPAGRSIVPGLDGETTPLRRAVRELEPVREPVGAAPPPLEQTSPNPWDAARLDPAESRDEDTEPTEPNDRRALTGETDVAEPASWHEGTAPGGSSWPRADEPEPAHASWEDARPTDWPDSAEAEAGRPPAAYSEPADPVPASWRPDDAEDEPEQPTPASWHRDEAEDEPDEPAPLLPPARRRDDLRVARTDPAAHPTEPEPETSVTGKPDEEPAPRLVARASLPTDVRLVGGPKRQPLSDTQPDGIPLPTTDPDGIPVVTGAADEEEDAYADERAEDPDAGGESRPPSGTFRSSPTPPRG